MKRFLFNKHLPNFELVNSLHTAYERSNSLNAPCLVGFRRAIFDTVRELLRSRVKHTHLSPRPNGENKVLNTASHTAWESY